MMIREKSYWWEEAKKAAAIVGWFPTVILAQWQWETNYRDANGKWIPFSSPNLLNNNNIAGQTWREWMPEFTKGTARPAAEGGYYIKYEDAVEGYTRFIKTNGRYSHVKDEKTEEGQIRAIAAAGWAADKNYANGLISVLNANKQQGYTCEVNYLMTKEDAKQIVAILSDYWHSMDGNKPVQDYTHHLANEVRKTCGMREDEDFE